MKLLHITTVPMSLAFLRGQVGYMKANGLEVHVLSSPGVDLDRFGREEGVKAHAVPMTRRITPIQDLIALARIWAVSRRIRPTIVHAHTPKGGLLGMMAALFSSAPVRIYQMRGLPFVTATGMRRLALFCSEWVSCRLACVVLCNSHSMRQIAIQSGFGSPEKIRVLGEGSGNGVDAEGRFNPSRQDPNIREETRRSLEIPTRSPVLGFVGRIVREKGIEELCDAWALLREDYPQAHLILVGPFEPHDPLSDRAVETLNGDDRIHLVGMNWDTPKFYSAMDIVVLPTHREGFPNVPLEASAMGLPVVATRISGCVDAVAEGETGLLVPPFDADALAKAVRTYLENPGLRRKHGKAGRDRVLQKFRQEALWEGALSEYTIHGGTRKPREPRHVLKRALDIIAAALGVVVLSPVTIAIGLIVYLRLGRPVLFRQQRPGRSGKPFTLYKFRTMLDPTDDSPHSPDELRVTHLGSILRSCSLDELPELWNVLKGDMSLVGPRPLLMEYLDLYTPRQARRHEVRPGITGWAQINGRNDTSWERRLELDVWYVENRSLLLDLVILLRTLKKVVLREGISQPGKATMERFRGTQA